ncbi:hypothetical protein HHL24_27070 [Paraburkholderia sp. RP-4-7]|uniref:Uncharacterized protein n=1 Tax=Paraburkholderia polaris TaxID=2728848 RepID=A0A848IR10_9BURK|nr:hypothetical protein [Paraburkholderia polaris]NMM01587.1 hypothetical protein [Paraburkholderia polaris]
MLDARVAHNIVKDNLPLYVEEPQTLITRAFNFTFDHINALRRRGDLTSRNLRRMVERRVLPTLNARGYGAWLSDVDGTPVLHCVVTAGNATLGLLSHGFVIRLTDGRCIDKSRISITPHAIARFLQRTDNPDFKSIIRSLKVALLVAESLRTSFIDAGCKQVAIPAGDGLFVGQFKEEVPEQRDPRAPHTTGDLPAERLPDSGHLCLELSTWFVPGGNGRESPWRRVKTYYGMKLRKLDNLPASELCNELRQTTSRMLTAPTITECFPFLQDAHERRDDIVETTWRMARKQASQPEPASLAA